MHPPRFALVEGDDQSRVTVQTGATAIDYVTPADLLAGRHTAITAERDRRLEAARGRRAPWRQAARGAAPSLLSSPAPLDIQPRVRYATNPSVRFTLDQYTRHADMPLTLH